MIVKGPLSDIGAERIDAVERDSGLAKGGGEPNGGVQNLLLLFW